MRALTLLMATLTVLGLGIRPVPAGVVAGPVPTGLQTPASRQVSDDEREIETENDEGEAGEDDEKDEDELTLERLFPEKGLFGPSARSMAFSHDGRYGAYLYRPYLERRHGADLWVFDTESGNARRITAASVMSKFQEATRKVRKDRIEKAKKRGAGKKKADDKTATEDDGISGTWEGRLTGEHDDVPPGGAVFTFVLEMDTQGSVSGTFKSSVLTAAIAKAVFDRDASVLEGTLADAEADVAASFRLEIDDGVMAGTMTMDGTAVVMEVEAKRAIDGDRDDGDDEEKNDQEEENEEEDGGDREQEDEGDGDGGDDVERDDTEGEQEEKQRDLGDIVDDKDADDEKAPRYGGVSAYTWAPHADELIFTSGGDLYRYDVASEEIVRLTRTRENEREVQYLPDGSGYTYLRGGELVKVTFGTHLIDQLDPKLGDGESMSSYRLSPDGNRLVILSSKGESYWSKGRKVNIVNYRDRFANVRQVTRHMPDDPLPEFEWGVYLYDMTGHLDEQGETKKVYTHKQSGPRDVMRVPEWSPDSTRVAFAVYEQTTGHVEILEARFLPPDPEDDEETETETDTESDESEGETGDEQKELDGSSDEDDEEGKEGDEGDEAEDEETDGPRIAEATPVYRLLHNGGPTTPRMIRPYYLADSRHLVFVTELSGFRHLHVLDPLYERLDQLTRGPFEVYPLEISKDHRRLFALANEDDPSQQHVYVVDLDTGALTRLTIDEGYYSRAAVSLDGTKVLANHADFGHPVDLVAVDATAATTERLTDSHPEEAKKLSRFIPEYFTYENRHGHTIHGHMFKPDDWSPEDRRPLLIYVYGGPLGTRKMVTRGAFSAPSYFFAYYMAKQHGYVTCTIDPRGVSGYGGLFEKSNFEQVGKPQVEDLVDATKWFVEHQGVDPDRIGLHGWSFGGFQTQMCLYTEPDVFACGIAGAGPTEWENYNSWYSTGTIGPSRKGKTDLDEFSLLPLAKNLKARLLLVHGMEDSNVLYQDTVRVYRELLKAGKEALVDLFLDPTGGHGLGGDVKTLNRYRKYEAFLLEAIGTGIRPEPAEPEEPAEEEEPGEEQEEAGSVYRMTIPRDDDR